MIDTFVNAVYVFDDKLVLTYNYQHGTQTISLDEIESALSSDFDGATPHKTKAFRLGFFFTHFLSKTSYRVCGSRLPHHGKKGVSVFSETDAPFSISTRR